MSALCLDPKDPSETKWYIVRFGAQDWAAGSFVVGDVRRDPVGDLYYECVLGHSSSGSVIGDDAANWRQIDRFELDDSVGEDIASATVETSGLTLVSDELFEGAKAVRFFVAGGEDGVDYTVTVRITSDLAPTPQILEESVIIPVRDSTSPATTITAPTVQLEVAIPASSTDLLTLDAVKARLSMTDDDAVILDYIAEVSSAIEDEAGCLLRQGYREVPDGHGKSTLLLSRHPIELGTIRVWIAGEEVFDWQVDSDEYAMLYRDSCWPRGSGWNSEGVPRILVEYTAGYVLPSAVVKWSAGESVAVGQWVKATQTRYLLEVTSAGVLGANEPVWPTESGASVTDNTATLVTREAQILPRQVLTAAYMTMAAIRDESRALGLVSQKADGFEERYGADLGLIPPAAMRLLDSLRRYAV